MIWYNTLIMNYLICEVYQQLNSQEELLIGWMDQAMKSPPRIVYFPPFSMMCSLVYLRLYMCEQSVDIALLRDFIIHMGNHWTSVVLLQCLNLVSNCVYYHKWVLPACHQPLIIFGELKVCIQKGILVLNSLNLCGQAAATTV